MTEPRERRAVSASYQLFMLVLCLYALVALAVQTLIRLNPETQGILDYADYVVCVLFFADFLLSLRGAADRWRYFVTWGWLDLLSSIPAMPIMRWGRAARVVRVLRVLRGVRAAKLLAKHVLRSKAESSFLAVSLVALLVIVFCSIAVLHVETDPASNIKSAEDALWWSFTTVTTVGYGDRFPVTAEGRLIAVILMCAGVGLFGTFSAFLAAWFIGPEAGEEGHRVVAEIRQLRKEVAELRRILERREGQGEDREP